MRLEALIQDNLSLYYMLMVLALGFSIFSNLKRENRSSQTKIAKYYIVLSIIMFVIFLLNYTVNKTLANLNNSYSGEFWYDLAIFGLTELAEMFESFCNGYPLLALICIVIGIWLKINLKIEIAIKSKLPGTNTRANTLGTSTVTNTISYVSNSNNVADKDKKTKRNFLHKKFYNEDDTLNELGSVVAKVALSLACTLLAIYLVLPILKRFEIEMFFSVITLLLVAVMFFELYFSLSGIKQEKKEDNNNVVEKKKQDLANFNKALKGVLKYSEVEDFVDSQKMIASRNEILDEEIALICEVPNFEEFKEVNMKVMNRAFFENKKVLVISASEQNAQEYYSNLTLLNAEYDGKISLKLLTEQDKLFDSAVDIYVSTLENCFGNIKLLKIMDTIIIEDFEVIMQRQLELLRAFGSIVRMGNPKINYVVITYMLQGIEATVKNLLLVKNVTWYSTENKQQAQKVLMNIWDKNELIIGNKILGKLNKNIGSLIPLSLLSLKSETDRIMLISQDEPLDFQLNELNAIKSLKEKSFDDVEIEEFNKKVVIKTREKYIDLKDRTSLVTNDKSNLYEKIYKLSLIKGNENQLDIISEQYLLRDYMINTYNENKTRLKSFLPYVPFEVDNSKVVLYNLLLQLTNFGLKEKNIIRVLKENGISVDVGQGNNLRLISDALNFYIKREFDLLLDVYSYLTVEEINDKYVFDTTRKDFIEKEKMYLLDKIILRSFPDELFKKVKFSKSGFRLAIEKEYAYNFYQKYLPGQKHYLNGHIYEIKNILDVDGEVNAIVEASTNYDNNTYRQARKINLLSDMKVYETKNHRYKNVSAKYLVGKIDYEIETKGYFEFRNGIIMTNGEYRYVELDNDIVIKTKRNHKNSDVLKLEFSRALTDSCVIDEIFMAQNRQNISNKIAFLLSEVLVTMLGENSNYIQVKSIIGNPNGEIDNNWVWPIEQIGYTSDKIEVYIFEDTQIERGLIDVIYKNMDNILNILFSYLVWSFEEESSQGAFKERRLEYLRSFEPEDLGLNTYRQIKDLFGEIRTL